MTQVRLDKYLSNAGCGTRSEVKQLLKKGLVRVNGEEAKRPEQKVNPGMDEVCCRGVRILREEFQYYMLNKPAGYVSATKDPSQPVVLDLIRVPGKEELFPVGRLDLDTEGLLLLTNDGALAHELLSPRKHVDKTYFARLDRPADEGDIQRFQDGLDIGEKKKTLPARLELGEDGMQVQVTIREGKFHQIKRMFQAVGKQVMYLKRLSMGSLTLDAGLKPGEWRKLTEQEIEGLRAHVRTKKSSHL